MSLRFGTPVPPRIHNPQLFLLGIVVGLAVILFSTFVVDKLGTAMFKRGFAKPFYIRGHRIHHSCIYFLVPAGYGLILALYFLGYVKFIWADLWQHVAFTVLLVGATLAVDFIGDRYWPKIRRDVILHHEWIYTLVPAYILAFVVIVVV
jgi:hypothetical protein